MSFFKTLSDSIGTASGVACPFFGIVAGSFGFVIGSTAAIILGSIAICLFSAVGLGAFYIIHNKNEAENLKLHNKTKAYLSEFIENYSQISRKSIFIESALKGNPIQNSFIQFIKEKYPYFLTEYSYKKEEILSEIINEFLDSEALDDLIPPPPFSTLASTFFMSTVAVFGAVAGASGGLTGIAIGLGLISGLVPALGIAIFVVTAIACITLATISTLSVIETNRKTLLYKSFKKFNPTLENLDLKTHELTSQINDENQNSIGLNFLKVRPENYENQNSFVQSLFKV